MDLLIVKLGGAGGVFALSWQPEGRVFNRYL